MVPKEMLKHRSTLSGYTTEIWFGKRQTEFSDMTGLEDRYMHVHKMCVCAIKEGREKVVNDGVVWNWELSFQAAISDPAEAFILHQADTLQALASEEVNYQHTDDRQGLKTPLSVEKL